MKYIKYYVFMYIKVGLKIEWSNKTLVKLGSFETNAEQF